MEVLFLAFPFTTQNAYGELGMCSVERGCVAPRYAPHDVTMSKNLPSKKSAVLDNDNNPAESSMDEMK